MNLDSIATSAANEHINFNCLHLEHAARLLQWQAVYDSCLAALRLYHEETLARFQGVVQHVSAN